MPNRRDCLVIAATAIASGHAAALADGAPASITATLLDGSAFATERLSGKVVVVNFWATWNQSRFTCEAGGR
jgi:thiol-disulfide isomerase/thioredoxin